MKNKLKDDTGAREWQFTEEHGTIFMICNGVKVAFINENGYIQARYYPSADMPITNLPHISCPIFDIISRWDFSGRGNEK